MAYEAKVIADSIAPSGSRLTTITATFPRIILAEWNTHRVFSRNAASSRAIPTSRMLKAIESDPYVPISWGRNKSGMQAGEELTPEQIEICKKEWNIALFNAINTADKMAQAGMHKQHVNRILEPFSWTTVITTATYWNNFLIQRCNEDAQPEIKKIAELVRDAIAASKPAYLEDREWHLPFIQEDEEYLSVERKKQISVARCARVSYLNHDGVRDLESDYKLYDRLINGTHWSPFEHVAQCTIYDNNDHGNFHWSWVQYRKLFPGENREHLSR